MTAGTTSRAQPEIFVARQPVYTAESEIFGYELLYRSVEDPEMAQRDPAMATSRVIAAALFAVGLDRLVGEARAFINFPHSWLVDGPLDLLPPARLVIDVQPDVPADERVVARCRSLHERGYLLAIDDYRPGDPRDALLPFAKIVKVDISKVGTADRAAIVQRARSDGHTPVAVRIETHDHFEETRDGGFTLFQGYYFERPNFVSGNDVPSLERSRAWAMKNAGRQPNVSEVADVVARDIGLVYKLMRYLREAAPWRSEVNGIEEALERLGPQRAMQWLVLATLTADSDGRHGELMKLSAVRARMCEVIVSEIELAHRSHDAFLIGALDKIDAVIGRPMREIVGTLDLEADVAMALVRDNEESPLAQVLALVDAFEAGGWDAVGRIAPALGLAPSRLSEIFSQALDWANREPTADRQPV